MFAWIAGLRTSRSRNWLRLALDALAVFVSYSLALGMRFDGRVPAESTYWFLSLSPFIVAVYLLCSLFFGVHRRVWQFASLYEVATLGTSVAMGTGLVLLVDLVAFRYWRPIPLSVVLMGGVLSFLTVGLARLWPRLALGLSIDRARRTRRVLIAGAGRAGQLVARELRQNREWAYQPVGFVDDDPEKWGLHIHGVPVLGPRQSLARLVEEYDVDLVVVAMPSAPGSAIRELVAAGLETSAKIQIVPGLPEIIEGQSGSVQLREITVDDLIGRAPVEIDSSLCARSIAGKTVLVTGAAGSIGSELCRQLLSFAPASLVMVDNNESGLYDVALELSLMEGESPIVPLLADVTDASKVSRVFAEQRPQIVFHAAAYKHVPLIEAHPDEGARVNVIGTYRILKAAQANGVEKVVLVSSDKAVNPSSVMGATKRIGELLMVAAGGGPTKFCAVRFGNVVASRGSVIPTFARQIEMGGPVTVTHPQVSRYFMTVSEAVRLIIQAAAFAESGDIYVLDMGEEIRVLDLAYKMIRLRGLRPGVDISIRFTGLRPGEKIREELVGEGEMLSPTSHPRIFRVRTTTEWPRDVLLGRVLRLQEMLRSGEANGALVAALLETAGSPLASSKRASACGGA